MSTLRAGRLFPALASPARRGRQGEPSESAPRPRPSWPRPGKGGAAGGPSPTHARTLGDSVHAPRARTARPPSTAPQPPPSFVDPLWGRQGPARSWGALLALLTAPLTAFPTTPCSVSPAVPPHLGQGPEGLRGAGSPRTQGPEEPQGLPASSTAPRLEPSEGCEGEQATAKAMARQGAQVPPALAPLHASLTQETSPFPCCCRRQPPACPTPTCRPTGPWARLGKNCV